MSNYCSGIKSYYFELPQKLFSLGNSIESAIEDIAAAEEMKTELV